LVSSFWAVLVAGEIADQDQEERGGAADLTDFRVQPGALGAGRIGGPKAPIWTA